MPGDTFNKVHITKYEFFEKKLSLIEVNREKWTQRG